MEFFDVIKDRKTIKTYKGKDLENKTWRYLQELVGRDCGAGSYHYTMKLTTDADLHNGQLRAVGSMPHTEETNNEPLKAEIKRLEQKLENASQGNGVTFDMLIQMTKQGYDIQVTFLKEQIQQKENYVNELKAEIRTLENDLDKADDIIEDLKVKPDLLNILNLEKLFYKES